MNSPGILKLGTNTKFLSGRIFDITHGSRVTWFQIWRKSPSQWNSMRTSYENHKVICDLYRTRCDLLNDTSFKVIQGQDLGHWPAEIRPDLRSVPSQDMDHQWELTTDFETKDQYKVSRVAWLQRWRERPSQSNSRSFKVIKLEFKVIKLEFKVMGLPKFKIRPTLRCISSQVMDHKWKITGDFENWDQYKISLISRSFKVKVKCQNESNQFCRGNLKIRSKWENRNLAMINMPTWWTLSPPWLPLNMVVLRTCTI